MFGNLLVAFTTIPVISLDTFSIFPPPSDQFSEGSEVNIPLFALWQVNKPPRPLNSPIGHRLIVTGRHETGFIHVVIPHLLVIMAAEAGGPFSEDLSMIYLSLLPSTWEENKPEHNGTIGGCLTLVGCWHWKKGRFD